MINDELRGYTVLLSLVLEACDNASVYRLRLELAKSETPGSPAISVAFDDVANLSLSRIGGGLSQVLYLNVEDIRDRQWDRANFSVSDLEQESISFTCKNVGPISRYVVGEEWSAHSAQK